MKCKNCGYKNPNSNKFCSECGAPLMDVSANSFKEDEELLREDEKNAYLNELEEGFSGGVDDLGEPRAAAYPEREEPSTIKKRVEQRNRQSGNNQARPGGSSIEAQRAARRSAAQAEDQDDGRRGSGSTLNKILAIVLFALLAALVVGVIYALKGGIGIGVSPKSQAEVRLNPNDPNKYYVTVRANEGTTVRFEGTDGSSKELEVSSKQDVTFNVHINSLLPQDYIETDTLTVAPTVFRIDSDGNKNIIEVPEVEIVVPKLMIDFETPDAFDSEDGVVTIKGRIATSQLNAELSVNGEQIAADQDGNFVYSVKRDKGEHDFEFMARKIGHTTVHKTFKANVTQVLTAEQIIVIPPSFSSRSLNVEESIRVYGAVPPGAKIAISSNDPDFTLKSEPEIDENGNFGFEVNLPTPAKAYKFFITATLEDGAVFERPFSVERPPVYNDYVPTVWPGNYSEMVKPVHVTDLRGFLIKGTVNEIFYDGDYKLAKFTLDSGELIEIEYHDHYSTASKLETGLHYTMYGHSLGTSPSPDGNLRLFIWFVQD